MSEEKHQILIIDSTSLRCLELCFLWSDILGYEVVFSDAGPFKKFTKGEPESIDIERLISNPPVGCLLHQGDKYRYRNSKIKEIIDSCNHVVIFGGTGVKAQADWPDGWAWIPRAIGGKHSASESEWKQLGQWFKPGSNVTAGQVELFRELKHRRFLIAIHILCQGFLAGERMRKRLPTAVAKTQTRDWWAVPLIESAGSKLFATVRAEWGPEMPESLATLVKWISDEPGYQNIDLATIVPAVKQEIENRLSK